MYYVLLFQQLQHNLRIGDDMEISLNQEQNIKLQRILMHEPWSDVSWIMDKLELAIAQEIDEQRKDGLTKE
jgi:hypothetical protein